MTGSKLQGSAFVASSILLTSPALRVEQGDAPLGRDVPYALRAVAVDQAALEQFGFLFGLQASQRHGRCKSRN